MVDVPDFYQESFHKKSNRGKPRHCVECGGLIEPGTFYAMAKGKWSGGFGYFMFHLTCHDVALKAWKWHRDAIDAYDEGPAIGELLEWAQEELRESKAIPPYWPEGYGVTKIGLQRYERDTRCTPNNGH